MRIFAYPKIFNLHGYIKTGKDESYIIRFSIRHMQQSGNLRRNNVYKEFYYHIKCENLEDFLSKDITQSVQYQNLLQDLMQIKGPVLYWYEITSSHSNNDIIRALKEYKQKRQRVTPVIYKTITDAQTFYT